MGKLHFFVLTFLVAFFQFSETTELPKNLNLIKSHIQKNADFSVDPCEDFYSHVCPPGDSFIQKLVELKKRLVKRYMDEHPEYQRFREKFTVNNKHVLYNFIGSDEIYQLCSNFPDIFQVWASSLDRKFEKDAFKYQPCLLADLVKAQQQPTEYYANSRTMMLQIVSGSVAHVQLKEADTTVRRVFRKLKDGVEKAIRKTPWAHNNKALSPYLKALGNLTLTTWADLHPVVIEAVVEYDGVMSQCGSSLQDAFSIDVADSICDVIATTAFLKQMQKPIPTIELGDLEYIFPDTSAQFNSNDDHVYIGNPFLFLALTDKPSDLYGSIGFSLTHEIMHTFVIEDADRKTSQLAPFWTNSYGCVEEQAMKTCRNFGGGNCGTHQTFEEDAADLAAYRVVWDVYQRGFSRKVKVQGYESLDERQLFFYGAAVLFCDKNRVNVPNDVHTGFHQRVNTIMSQMDDFANAFQCKDTDRIVRNKATHCELYGANAPITRKTSSQSLN